MNIKTIGLAITLLLIRMLKRVNKEVELIVEEILFKFASSVGNLHFEPRDTMEVVVIAAADDCALVKFRTNQLLISSDLKCHHSATKVLDSNIIYSHCTKSYFTREELYLADTQFTLGDSGYDLCDLFGLVELVALIEFTGCATLD